MLSNLVLSSGLPPRINLIVEEETVYFLAEQQRRFLFNKFFFPLLMAILCLAYEPTIFFIVRRHMWFLCHFPDHFDGWNKKGGGGGGNDFRKSPSRSGTAYTGSQSRAPPCWSASWPSVVVGRNEERTEQKE